MGLNFFHSGFETCFPPTGIKMFGIILKSLNCTDVVICNLLYTTASCAGTAPLPHPNSHRTCGFKSSVITVVPAGHGTLKNVPSGDRVGTESA